MPALWFEFSAAGHAYRSPCARLIEAEAWQPGEPFHPDEAPRLAEDAHVAPDGTRIAVYYPRGMFGGGRCAIAAYGDAPQRTAAAIQAALGLDDPREEDAFHRYLRSNTAACAAPGGVWLVDSIRGELLWHATGEPLPRIVADELASPFAIAHGLGGIVVTSCDDPRRSRLARVDPATGAVRWLAAELDRPTQIAGLGDVVYAACADGLVRVDRSGARERLSITAPAPRWLAADAGALTWIDVSGRHVVRWDGQRAELLATGSDLISLDVDDARAYALQADGMVIGCRPGRAPQQFQLRFEPDWYRPLVGVLRLGAFLVSADEGQASPYSSKLRCQLLAIGLPELDAAPPALLAQLARDPESRGVVADWLEERGVLATAEQIARSLDASREPMFTDVFESEEERPGVLATSLVTADRRTGYHVIGNRIAQILRSDDW